MRIVHLSLQMGRRVVNAPFCSAQCVERLIVRGNWCTSDSPTIKSDASRINYKTGWSVREFEFVFGGFRTVELSFGIKWVVFGIFF